MGTWEWQGCWAAAEDGQSEHESTLCAVVNLAFVHAKLDAVAKARLLMEEVVAVQRRTQPVDPARFTSIGNLGSRIFKAGDNTVGVALREEATASASRELGPEHPITQQEAGLLAAIRQDVAQDPPGTRNARRPGLQAGAQRRIGIRGRL